MSSNATSVTSGGFFENLRDSQFLKNYRVLLFLIVLIAISAFFTPGFLATGTIDKTLRHVFPIMLVSLGMTMVISSGGIDISVGAVMAISAAATARLYTGGAGIVLSLCGGFLAAILCGLFTGVLVSKFRIQPIIVTLVVMFEARGLAQMILGGFPVSLMFTPIQDFGRLRFERLGNMPVQVVILLAVVGAMLLMAKKTVFAKQVEAIGDNPTAARLVGINVAWVTIGVYVLCAALCAIAGTMEAAVIGNVNGDKLGKFIELDAIAAVAIGGTPFSGGKARIMGTVVGAIVIQLVTAIVNMNGYEYHYALILKAIVLVVAVWTQQERR